MKKEFREENLINTSIIEALLLFLFIFLAITSITTKLLEEKNKIISENKILGQDSTGVSIDDKIFLDSLKEELEVKELVEKDYLKNLEAIKDSLNSIAEYDTTGLDTTVGIAPPPCYMGENNLLFEIELLSGENYLIKFKNLTSTIILDNYTIKNGSYRFHIDEFRKFGRELHDSKSINKNEEFCLEENNPRWRNDSRCIECKYYGRYYVYDYSKKENEFNELINEIEYIQRRLNFNKSKKHDLELKIAKILLGSKKDLNKQVSVLEVIIGDQEKSLIDAKNKKDAVRKILKNKFTESERTIMIQTMNLYFGGINKIKK